MAKYRIGIIGFGKIARDQHAPAIAASSDFELSAISNIGSGSPPEGIPSFATPTEMLQNLPDLDAVSLCTPPGPRRMIAAQCLAAGKHVLLEKPPAATVAEVDDLDRRAQAAAKIVFATYHAQHNAAVEKAAQVLANSVIRTLNVTWKEDIRQWHPSQNWILEAGGFGIFDPGINALSILTRILPQAIFVNSANLMFPSNRQAPIAADLIFSTGTNADEQLSASFDWRQKGPPTWEIAIETAAGSKLRLAKGGSVLEQEGQIPLVGPSDEYADIYREFAALLAAGSKSRIDGAPFQLVADAFMVGRRTEVDAFEF